VTIYLYVLMLVCVCMFVCLHMQYTYIVGKYIRAYVEKLVFGENLWPVLQRAHINFIFLDKIGIFCFILQYQKVKKKKTTAKLAEKSRKNHFCNRFILCLLSCLCLCCSSVSGFILPSPYMNQVPEKLD
jgi:nitric oxide reductase large subunit